MTTWQKETRTGTSNVVSVCKREYTTSILIVGLI
jgi:hypothetical protein